MSKLWFAPFCIICWGEKRIGVKRVSVTSHNLDKFGVARAQWAFTLHCFSSRVSRACLRALTPHNQFRTGLSFPFVLLSEHNDQPLLKILSCLWIILCSVCVLACVGTFMLMCLWTASISCFPPRAHEHLYSHVWAANYKETLVVSLHLNISLPA